MLRYRVQLAAAAAIPVALATACGGGGNPGGTIVPAEAPAGPGAGFSRVENDLSQAIAADQVIFHSSATAGKNAFTGLAVGTIAAAVLMATGCTWGLARRLAEYR